MTDPTELSEATDEELVRRLREAGQGDLRAFDALVRRHERKVATNCRYISGSPSDAPDLTQEVFVKAFFALKRFEGRSSFSTWIQRIKTNHCINYLNKKRHPTVDLDDPVFSGEAELSVKPEAPGNLERMDQRAVIRAVLDEMSETLRVPLIMRDMDGFSYQEIADELGIGLSAVKMRIARGRDDFRSRFAELQGEPPKTSPSAA
ncbi:MAG: sigma-70 family RNA polymerase sigma factor [Gemmatimonadota bacterium]|nr:sigma-70 family RNA polymerase sigma factor [Gemmatimonadota bacterium]